MKRYYVRFALLLFLSDSLQAQHSLWTWGNNDYGTLGDGYWTPADGGTHAAVPGVVSCFDDWVAVSAGQERCSAIRQDGSLWEWGVGIYIGMPISEVEYQSPYFAQTVPMQIGTDHDWVSLCTSGDVTFARKADGSVWGWGNNTLGQLGDGTFTSRSRPVRLGTGWRDVATYDINSAGIRNDGTLWTWGQGGELLGDGTPTNQHRHTPAQVGTDTDWHVLAKGGIFSLVAGAIKEDGSLWMWGGNFNGELGLGAAAVGQKFATPQRVGTNNDWKSVAIGLAFTLAQKTDGSLWAWGINNDGQLGDGTTTNRPAPVRIGTATDWSSLSAGGGFALAAKADGSLWAWGGSVGGGAVYGNTPRRIGTSNLWKTVSAGYSHAMALHDSPHKPFSTTLDLGVDIETCQVSEIITANITDGIIYKWITPGSTAFLSGPGVHAFTATRTGTHELVVTKAGCRQTDAVEVTLISVSAVSFELAGTHVIGCPPGDYYDQARPVEFINTTPNAANLSFTWELGDGNTVTAPHALHTYAQAGVHTVKLSTTAPCMQPATIQVYVMPVLRLGGEIFTCRPTVTLAANVPGADAYTWQTPGGTITGQPTITAQTGTYTATVLLYGCTQSDQVVVALPENTVQSDFSITAAGAPIFTGGAVLNGMPVDFAIASQDGAHYSWTFDHEGTPAQESSVQHTYTAKGAYVITLTVTDKYGCSSATNKSLHVLDLTITDAISPNGDGKNDRLVITPFLYDAELKIMDRAGRTVYQASPYNNDFSGQNLESDVYFYELQFREVGKRYKGYVHVIK